ncbi:DUF7500 family protein [Natronomonas marina]|jgi:hypothetical protein|uniref:DUF7500 family protein n=1 Tax=Natronomonas marina TaxID=2961939 RepID=UPI0020CA0E10|nr:hypothetical protein [Natronomonas marina]
MTPDTPDDDPEEHRTEAEATPPDADEVAAVIDAEELPRLARLESDDRVSRLDEERFVVSTDPETDPSGQATDRPERAGADRSADGDGGHRPFDTDAAFAVSIAVETPNGRAETTIAHDDIRETFAELLRWYATAVEPDRDPAAVLSVLLREVDVEAP